ncbi:MAG: sensor histidine kinase [Campylobacterales bacterium]
MKLFPATIKNRVIASVVLIHAVLMLVIVADITYREYRFMQTQSANQAQAIAATLAANAPLWLLSRDLGALEELLSSAQGLSGFYMAQIMDASGRVVAANDRRYVGQRFTDPESVALLEPLFQGRVAQSARLHHDLSDVAHVIRVEGRTIGFVRLMLRFEEVKRELWGVIIKGVVYALLAIVAGAAVAWLMMNALSNRIAALTRSATQIAAGDLQTPLPQTAGADELDTLTSALRTMQAAIGRQMDDLHSKRARVEKINELLADRVEAEVQKQRRQEQVLIQQSKMAAMGEMINAIAHQWRQPLNGLVLLVQDLQDAHRHGELDEAYLQASVKRSLELANFMSCTIDDFRSFFKPSKEMSDFNLIGAVEEVMRLISAQLNNHKIAVHFKKPAQNITVRGYPNEFKQVLVNILNNARQAIESVKPAGKIVIACRSSDGEHHLSICDEGPGIPEALREKIFEPYYTTKLDSGGTGIGLYMSKIIIENNMKGRLHVADAPGGGACFEITLPKP